MDSQSNPPCYFGIVRGGENPRIQIYAPPPMCLPTAKWPDPIYPHTPITPFLTRQAHRQRLGWELSGSPLLIALFCQGHLRKKGFPKICLSSSNCVVGQRKEDKAQMPSS